MQCSKRRDICDILGTPDRFLEPKQGVQSNDSQNGSRREFLDQRQPIFLSEVEGLRDEHVDRCLSMLVTMKVEHRHSFFVDPPLPLYWIGNPLRRDRNARTISQRHQGSERSPYGIRIQRNDQVDVLR